MGIYTKRVQAVLTEEQYKLLQDLAQEQGKSLSVLIREAVELEYFQKSLLKQRRQALKHLLSMAAPVSDWRQIESEINQGVLEKHTKSKRSHG